MIRSRRFRILAMLVLASLAAAACDEGSIELRSRNGNGEGREPPPTFLLVPDDGGGDTGAPSGTSIPAPGGGDGGSSGGGGARGGESPSSGGEPATGVPVNDRAKVGAMARALLSASVPEVAIEIDTTPGESLTSQARTALQAQIGEHGNKQSVGFVAGSTLPEQDVYTSDELRSLMEAHRSTWSSSRRAGVYVMVLSGRHEDDGVVGASFGASSFAVFTEQLGGGLLGLNYAVYEKAVVVHELGHLFGLVNLTGKGGFHEDPEHRSHSKNRGSVMYWAVESTVVGDVFEGGPPQDFDADDEQEMAAIRTG